MVITDVNKVIYNGDGVVTAWPYTFRIINRTDIRLMLIDTDGTSHDIESDYYVDMVNSTVYYPGYAAGSEPPEEDQPPKVQPGQKIVVYRKLPINQLADLGEKWPFALIELGLDKLTMILQDIWDWLGRCLSVSLDDSINAGDDFDPTVPLAADKVVCGNENGTGFVAREALMEVNGAWDGEGRQIRGVADPTDNQDAATKNYVDTLTDGQFMKLQPDGAAWEGRNLPISNVAGPASVKDAANKDYVDRILAGYSGQGDRFVFFDNVAQMQAAELVPSQMAVTMGYHDVNDGGMGVYSIRAAQLSDVDDGGSIIILDNGNVAELICDGVVNVKQFGAYGDNTHDDSTAIQNAINFASATTKNLFFPKSNYICGEVDIDTDYFNIDFGGAVLSCKNDADYVVRMINTDANTFKNGGTWKDVIFSGTATESYIVIEGGTWTNQIFCNIFAENDASALAIIKYKNTVTSPNKNPSNFTFKNCRNQGYGVKYFFYYYAASTGMTLDNFVFENILHRTNQTNPAVFYFENSGAGYCNFANIYGAMYADDAAIIRTSSTSVAVFRSSITKCLMEGEGDSRKCLDGYFSECQISEIINYVDTNTYNSNVAIYAKVHSSTLFMCLLQGSLTGYELINPSVELLSDSYNNIIKECHVVSDSGHDNTIVKGKNDYIANGIYNKQYTEDNSDTVITLNPEDYKDGDIIRVYLAGQTKGNKIYIALHENNVGVIVPSGEYTAQNFEFEGVYQVYVVGTTKYVSRKYRQWQDNTCIFNSYVADRTFNVPINIFLNVFSYAWTDTEAVLKTAYAEPLYNNSLR